MSSTAASSARFYWENFPPNTGEITVPCAVTIFPADIEQMPQPWVEGRFADLHSFRVPAKGGRFPMLEVPGICVDELKRGLQPLTRLPS